MIKQRCATLERIMELCQCASRVVPRHRDCENKKLLFANLSDMVNLACTLRLSASSLVGVTKGYIHTSVKIIPVDGIDPYTAAYLETDRNNSTSETLPGKTPHIRCAMPPSTPLPPPQGMLILERHRTPG
jgi:hypothetical protein